MPLHVVTLRTLQCHLRTSGWDAGVIVQDRSLLVTPEAGISRLMLSDLNSTRWS